MWWGVRVGVVMILFCFYSLFRSWSFCIFYNVIVRIIVFGIWRRSFGFAFLSRFGRRVYVWWVGRDRAGVIGNKKGI